MQPRLKNSKKWSPLPQELIKQIQSVFSQSFREHIKGGKIEAGGRIYPEEILIRVGYKAPGNLKQANWDLSIAYKKDKDNVLKLLHLGVDAVGALFEQFFTSENDYDFPRTWEEIDFEGRKVFVQYDTTNNELESEADKLLGLDADSEDVAQGEWDEASADQIKASLGIDPDETEDADDVDVDEDGSSSKKPQTH
ncbi:MAG: hypothetical protein KF799_12760 [Bdellovibrionales bacterium]|nr:hypothetical protein [Bdellovibrionales bacterium]